MKHIIRFICCLTFILFCIGEVNASEYGHALSNFKVTQDIPSRQRGAKVYYHMCRVCHSLKYIRYKNLLELGFDKDQIDKLRADHPLNATFEKTTSDNILIELYGQVPTDLSVMAKARKNGPQYIYTLLTSYSVEQNGEYKNTLRPGIAMPDIMNISTAMDDAEIENIKQLARDVSEFLLWTSEPLAAERKSMGVYIIFYLMVLNILLYIIMKRVWSRLEEPSASASATPV